jgi:multidrug efflux pump subunit AcrA (membrane-fusion protein)
LVIVLVALVLAWARHFGYFAGPHTMSVLAERTDELAAPSVIAIAPKPGDRSRLSLLPGNVTSYTDSPIYARTSGYLTHWYFDIGAKVKKGALLAEIASPKSTSSSPRPRPT